MSKELTRQELFAAMAMATPEQGVDLLAGLPAREAFNLAFEHPEPEKVFALLPVENAYLMMHEMGTDDALILLEQLTPEQVQGFIDIDCWAKDEVDLPKARTWYLLLNELSDERFISDMQKMDLAYHVAFFSKHVVVHKFENIDDAIDVEGGGFLTPDNRHLVQYVCSLEQSRLINALIVRIYDMAPDFFYLLLEAIYWEHGTEVEEQAYQERNSRLSSRGFPDYYDALEIVAVVELDRFQPRRKVGASALAQEPGAKVSSSTYLTHYEHPDSLLRRALAQDFPAREEVSVEIMGLANMAVVAARVPFFELEEVRRLVVRTDGYLSIGLEHRVGLDEDEAREQLAVYRCLDIHKIGRSLVMRLVKRARAMLKTIAVDRRSPSQLLVDTPEADVVQALLEREPAYFSEGKQHSWSTLAQIRAVDQILQTVAAFAALMDEGFHFTPGTTQLVDLAGTNVPSPADLSYRLMFNTFRCHDLLGHEPSLEPLSPDDLQAVTALFVPGEDGRPDLPQAEHDKLREWLSATVGETDAARLGPLLDRFTRGMIAEIARHDLALRYRLEILVHTR